MDGEPCLMRPCRIEIKIDQRKSDAAKLLVRNKNATGKTPLKHLFFQRLFKYKSIIIISRLRSIKEKVTPLLLFRNKTQPVKRLSKKPSFNGKRLTLSNDDKEIIELVPNFPSKNRLPLQ